MKKIIYIAALAALTACSTMEQPQDGLRPDPNGKVLKATVISTFDGWNIDSPQQLVKQQNLLVVNNYTASKSLSSVDLSLNQRTDRITRSGENEEAYYISALDASSGKEYTALNFRTGQLYVTPMDQAEGNPYSIQLPADAQHLIAAKAENFVISTGLYEQGRYLFYCLDDHSANYYLSYPEHPQHPDMSERTKSILYASSVLRLRPDAKAFVCSDIHSGLLDICRIEGNRIERVKQQCFYHPRIRVYGSTPQNTYIAYDRSSIQGFLDIAVSNEHIYVLYSGKSTQKDRYNIFQCRTLLTFDWEGTLLSSEELEVPATNIAYDKSEKALYGIGYTPDATLVRYNL